MSSLITARTAQAEVEKNAVEQALNAFQIAGDTIAARVDAGASLSSGASPSPQALRDGQWKPHRIRRFGEPFDAANAGTGNAGTGNAGTGAD